MSTENLAVAAKKALPKNYDNPDTRLMVVNVDKIVCANTYLPPMVFERRTMKWEKLTFKYTSKRRR